MDKIQSFKTFSELKEQEKQQQSQKETEGKIEQLATKIAETLAEMKIVSLEKLSEKQRKQFVAKLFNEDTAEDIEDDIKDMGKPKVSDVKDGEELEAEVSESLTTEATRWQFGLIDKAGNIQSNYVHYDGYPNAVIPILKNYSAKDVKTTLVDSAMGGMSSLDANPKQNKYYNDAGDSTIAKGNVKDIKNYLKSVDFLAGAEYVYLYDERDGKWYGADVFTDKKLKPVEQLKESVVTEATLQEIDKKVQKFVIKNANDYEYSNQSSAFQIYLALKKLYPRLIKESVVTEGKDDFMARSGSANINLKKGYKHHTEKELTDLYNTLGDLVKTLNVKDVTLIFESTVNEAEVKSDVEFKEYAETVLQKAFGEDYDETKAQEVIDGLISKYSDDYGAMVGALQSSLD